MHEISTPENVDMDGRPLPPFPIKDQLSLFEWAMVYTDKHPHAYGRSDGSCSVDMQVRLELIRSIPAGSAQSGLTRIELFYQMIDRVERCGAPLPVVAHLNDARNQRDWTRCKVGEDVVLAIARERGDYGEV